jgi:transcriptional regulator with XRE-family HTH domain
VKKSPAPKTLRKRLAAQVRGRREALGWSQEQLAERAGTSQVYVSHVESAKRAVSIDIVERLGNAFSVSPELLLCEPE